MVLLSAILIAATAPQLPTLRVKGPDLVDPAGKRVLLKGCNLGNWLVIEPWMLSLDGKIIKDQYELEQILTGRFGQAENERLMDLYKSHWLTERDFKIIPTFGMNAVRLPMNYRLMEDDANPFKLRKDAWQWIDKAIDMSEKHGLYTILDMHGAQGGQSVYDHTGRVEQNKLWSVKENRDRLAWLWTEIAKRYKNRSAVVAYDVFNEPYGGSKPDQKAVFSQVYKAIRKVDTEKMVYAMGNWDDFSHYGSPKENGWRNVAYQMHYYPGLFGGGDPTISTHAKHLKRLDLIAQQVKAWNAPFLVGEMNVVFKGAGGGGMMRRTFDKHASFGWATTMWSYKVLSKEGGIGDGSWGMVTNRQPAQMIDFRTAPKAEIEKYFKSFSTQPYEIYQELREALTSKNPKLPVLPVAPEPVYSVSSEDMLPFWTSTDIGGSLKGGLRAVSPDTFELFGGGADVWAKQDQFRFLHRPVQGPFELTVTVNSLADVDSYSKGGLMLRRTLDADAPAVLISTFPSAEVQVAVRPSKGVDMQGIGSGKKMSFPVRLRLVASGENVDVYCSKPGQAWEKLATTTLPGSGGFAGPIALSHDNRQLVKAVYSGLDYRTP